MLDKEKFSIIKTKNKIDENINKYFLSRLSNNKENIIRYIGKRKILYPKVSLNINIKK
tara:strand:- start:20 stop:193 length:174 start_codon:yes stop_codon:yes gene_type:complete